MRLEQLYKSGKPEISVEFFPPKTPEGVAKLFGETIPHLNRIQPVYFSMTFGAGGTTRDLTIELCDRIKNEAKVETVCHLNIVGQSKEDTRENLRRIKAAGVYNLLALRGDPPKDRPDFKPHPDGFHSSVELVEEARKDPWFSIAVTGFPEVHPEAKDRSADMAYLKRKLEAGGRVIITQFFLDNAYFFEFMDLVKKAGITAPVVPGILPILSASQVRRFAALCGSTIPPAVEKELSKVENDEEGAIRYGIELATRMCGELIKSGVPGLHFYALNRSRSTSEILSNLNLA
ncbi:MAG: methylenetetrahydrofolate reductase [NAD(P)H] [Candidatus Omnitrophota bacterium]|nr:methylenetetrahydrofolate reductase [NAD(P)H] [Candidatus Omnitrophota bacterium]